MTLMTFSQTEEIAVKDFTYVVKSWVNPDGLLWFVVYGPFSLEIAEAEAKKLFESLRDDGSVYHEVGLHTSDSCDVKEVYAEVRRSLNESECEGVMAG